MKRYMLAVLILSIVLYAFKANTWGFMVGLAGLGMAALYASLKMIGDADDIMKGEK